MKRIVIIAMLVTAIPLAVAEEPRRCYFDALWTPTGEMLVLVCGPDPITIQRF